MRIPIICAAILSVMLPAVALADVPVVKTGMLVTSAEGRRVGRVYQIEKAKDGTVQAVTIIRDLKMVRILASTLSANDKGLTTSLSNAEINKLD